MPDPIKDIAAIAQAAASIVKDVKPDARIIEKRAERIGIKNTVRAAKAERKIGKIKGRMERDA